MKHRSSVDLTKVTAAPYGVHVVQHVCMRQEVRELYFLQILKHMSFHDFGRKRMHVHKHERVIQVIPIALTDGLEIFISLFERFHSLPDQEIFSIHAV